MCNILFWKQSKKFLISVQHHMCHRYVGEPVCSSSSQKQGETNQKFSCDVKLVWPRRSSVHVIVYKIMWKIIEMFLRLLLILMTFLCNRINGLLDVQCRYEGWLSSVLDFFTFGHLFSAQSMGLKAFLVLFLKWINGKQNKKWGYF